jgi:hypothetical protein
MTDRKTRAQARLLAGAGAICLLVVGCVSQPLSADVTFGGSAQPPAVVASSRPASSLDGIYVGSADVEVNGNLVCPTTMTITNFRVEGTQVRFGGFEGPIASDGTVNLLFQGMVLNGRFVSSGFDGHVDTTSGPDVVVRPLRTCLYAIRVHRLTA